MKKIIELCKNHNISLCYLFGSQVQPGKDILDGKSVPPLPVETDIDFAVVFSSLPSNPAETYAKLSLHLLDLVAPYQSDLVFMHEVDHLLQLEAIKGLCLYSANQDFQAAYEDKIMTLAADELVIFRKNEKDFFEAVEDGYFEFKYQAT